jgi:hypothetical protein
VSAEGARDTLFPLIVLRRAEMSPNAGATIDDCRERTNNVHYDDWTLSDEETTSKRRVASRFVTPNQISTSTAALDTRVLSIPVDQSSSLHNTYDSQAHVASGGIH